MFADFNVEIRESDDLGTDTVTSDASPVTTQTASSTPDNTLNNTTPTATANSTAATETQAAGTNHKLLNL